MKIISDMHIHSRYSRACSKQLSIANLEKYAKIKGLNLLGTGDFQHPEWQKELKKELTDDGTGIAKTKNGFSFVYSTEVSLIYTDGKGRRIHLVTIAPNMETVEQITEALGKRGRLDYDGRPIFKITCPEYVEMMRRINPDIEVIPAHIWTPWFGLFGSMSGFDSMTEAFKDQSKHIHAIETGLSSDPPMNWRIKELDDKAIVSFSDLHSFWPWRMGRECTIFDAKKINYESILKAIRNKEVKETIEFFPEEGKYHYDGHRNCGIVMSPKQTKKHKGICPVCKKPLTKGVAYRVEELADREPGYKPKTAKPFRHLIPLSEIIAGATGAGIATQKTWKIYTGLQKIGNEMQILLETPEEKLAQIAGEKIAKLIIKNRKQKIKVEPGYDGVYGKPVFNNSEGKKEVKPKKQAGLKEFY